ncbi:MAG: PLDc N-terminal domain-containing protein [Maricaulaceae bacterium]
MSVSFDNLNLLGVLWLVLWLWALISIVQSESGALWKAIGVVFVLLVPVLGFLVWLFLGPKAKYPVDERSSLGRAPAGLGMD